MKVVHTSSTHTDPFNLQKRGGIVMVLIRYFAVISMCLCILFSASCTINDDGTVGKSMGDKAMLYADTICDDESHIYFLKNREVLKIDKSTLAVYETGLPATNVSFYDGALYRMHKGVFYKDDTVISLPEDPYYQRFMVGKFGCCIPSREFNISYLSSDLDDLRYWKEIIHMFPVVDNKGNAHFCKEKEVGDYFYYVIDGITVHRTLGSYMQINDWFHIYDNHLYFVSDHVLNIVSLQNGHRSQKPYTVDRILAVGHNTIYFRVDDQIMKEDLSSGKLMECTSPLPKTAECYVDSYRDTVYIIDSDDEKVECSIATFNEHAS